MRSLKGLLILANAVKKLKWSAFIQTIQSNSITAVESNLKSLNTNYLSKDLNTCKASYKICLEGSIEVGVLYKKITDTSSAASVMVHYWNIIGVKKSADRKGNWKGHLQAI